MIKSTLSQICVCNMYFIFISYIFKTITSTILTCKTSGLLAVKIYILYSSSAVESCLVLPDSQLHLPIAGNLLRAPPRCPLSALCPGNSKKTVSGDNCRADLIFSPFLRDHCPSLPDAQCLENHCFIYSVQFFGCVRRDSEFSPWYSITVRRESWTRSLTAEKKSHWSPISYYTLNQLYFTYIM